MRDVHPAIHKIFLQHSILFGCECYTTRTWLEHLITTADMKVKDREKKEEIDRLIE